MEPLKRKPFQGVVNIVRFNWHYYVIAAVLLTLAGLSLLLLTGPIRPIIILLLLLALVSMIVSLIVSWYVYDLSGLYTLNWLDRAGIQPGERLVNINAGFDETSALLQQKYPGSLLRVFDFYDPARHTEISIERARKAYPSYPGTLAVSTDQIPLTAGSTDRIFLILAAHEIRKKEEQVIFFRQLGSSLAPKGTIIVTEHQRDFFNFIAYNFGFLHFLSPKSWKRTFGLAGLSVSDVFRITPFITTYILTRNGTSS